MNRFVFVALSLIFVGSTVSAAPVRAMTDDDFNGIVGDINESVAKLVAAQAKRSREVKAPKTYSCTPAQVDAAYVALPVCEASIKKAFGADVRDSKGAISKGFGRGGMSLVLLTTTDAFFYHEDCDICAAIERCSLKDGSISNLVTAHSADCGDLAPFLKKNVAFSACPLKP